MAVKKDKKPKSRRDKFHEWITPEGLSLIGGWARDGLIDEQIAKNMGITRATLYEWRKRFPDISDALKTNKEVADKQVENALYKKANGYEYEEHKTFISTDSSGKEIKKVEVYKRYAQPDTTAIIYWLKNRKPDQWRNITTLDREKASLELEKIRLSNQKEAALIAILEDQIEKTEGKSTQFEGLIKDLLKAVGDD